MRPEIQPVPARSAVLSLLLGCHPPVLPVRDVVTAMASLGISESTTRVAISRMVGSGDLLRDGSTYALSERLVERQRRQDAAIEPAPGTWDGRWELVVVTGTGRRAAERAALRTALGELRLAELREGVWMRPANLPRPWPGHLVGSTRRLLADAVDDPADLAAGLWDLTGWATYGEGLLALLGRTTDPAARFAVMAAAVRHLLVDPVLPAELSPAGWPGERLRSAYSDYRAELSALIPTEHDRHERTTR